MKHEQTYISAPNLPAVLGWRSGLGVCAMGVSMTPTIHLAACQSSTLATPTLWLRPLTDTCLHSTYNHRRNFLIFCYNGQFPNCQL